MFLLVTYILSVPRLVIKTEKYQNVYTNVKRNSMRVYQESILFILKFSIEYLIYRMFQILR